MATTLKESLTEAERLEREAAAIEAQAAAQRAKVAAAKAKAEAERQAAMRRWAQATQDRYHERKEANNTRKLEARAAWERAVFEAPNDAPACYIAWAEALAEGVGIEEDRVKASYLLNGDSRAVVRLGLPDFKYGEELDQLITRRAHERARAVIDQHAAHRAAVSKGESDE